MIGVIGILHQVGQETEYPEQLEDRVVVKHGLVTVDVLLATHQPAHLKTQKIN